MNARPHLILLALWLMVFSSASQVMILGPILPRISEQLGVEIAVLGTLVTAYALAVGVFALVTGPISDRFGRRRVLLVGTATMSAALWLHVFAASFAALFLVRLVAGAAGGVLAGGATAFVGDYFPSARRGWANGWIMSGLAAGQIAGIPLGTVLAGRFGFQAPFLAFALTMAFAFGLIFFLIPDLEPGSRKSLSVANALGGYFELLRRPATLSVIIAFIFLFASIALLVIYLPAWLETFQGFSPNAVAALYFTGGLANVVAGPRFGELSDRVGRKRVILGISLVLTALLLATPWIAVSHVAIFALFFLLMALFAGRASVSQALVSELVESDQRGSLISLTVAIGQIGFGLGSAVAGFLYIEKGFASNAFSAAGAVLVAALIMWFFLPETHVPPKDRRRGAAGAARSSG